MTTLSDSTFASMATPATPLKDCTPRSSRTIFWGCAALLLLVLQGCASAPHANLRDPWEPFNRNVYNFNEGLDNAVVKPVATAYENVTPQVMRTGVNNFFGNIADVWSLVNNVLQLKPAESVETLFRIGVNSTVGLLGLVDVATELKLEKHTEDFGQTLGFWGVPTGPYVVLPVFGPSTLRDTLALPVDAQGNLVNSLNETALRNSLITLRLVNLRASLLAAGKLLDAAALDKYSFTRDAYLQRRRGQSLELSQDVIWDEERYDLPLPAKNTAVPASGSRGVSPADAKTPN
jgi:phospholipid-binding lipoprotein MlaA